MSSDQIIRAWKADEDDEQDEKDEQAPENPAGEELSDEDLEDVAGGGSGVTCRDNSCNG